MRRLIATVAILVLGGTVLAACGKTTSVDKQRETAIAARGTSYDRAVQRYPAPTDLTNYPIRGALVKFTKRQDLVNHPWYIYILNMQGEYTEFWVGQTYPISTCDFLSSTENVVHDDHGNVVTTAPSYDGVFYGGGGASAACTSLFFFDYESDALVTFASPFWRAVDQPIDCNCPRKTQAATPVAGR